MVEGIKEAARLVLQYREDTRKQALEPPLSVRDLRNVHDNGNRRKKIVDAKGVIYIDRSPHDVATTKLSGSINQ